MKKCIGIGIGRIILLISGCGIQGKATVEGIRFGTWNTGTHLLADKQLAKDFTAVTGIAVEIVPYEDILKPQLTTALTVVKPPDVMLMWDFPRTYKAVEPLDI